MTEQQVQRQIKEWLEKKGAHVTKYNANGYGVAGHPDLFVSAPVGVLLHPVAFFIEVKTDMGRLSSVQRLKINRMKFEGHYVVVARCINDVEKFLKEKNINF